MLKTLITGKLNHKRFPIKMPIVNKITIPNISGKITLSSIFLNIGFVLPIIVDL